MKKILIHSPYWSAGGGGERYALTAAGCLRQKAEVFVTVKSVIDLEREWKKFGLPSGGVPKVFFDKLTKTELATFWGILWVSDGSIPFLPVRKRVIHFQAPFQHIDGATGANKLKLLGTTVVCNSIYTGTFIDREFQIKSRVIYPPVEVKSITPGKKENLILSVGRFSTGSQHKRPEVMVETMKKLVDNGLTGWRLVIVGIIENHESEAVASSLRVRARGYPIAIRSNLSHERLIGLYRSAKIYWHAAGFGTDLKKFPERAEHFGISTVEAMAAGAVPIAFAAGGQLEIIIDQKNGILWKTIPELMNQTIELISNSESLITMSRHAVDRAQIFSRERFCQEIRSVFGA